MSLLNRKRTSKRTEKKRKKKKKTALGMKYQGKKSKLCHFSAVILLFLVSSQELFPTFLQLEKLI